MLAWPDIYCVERGFWLLRSSSVEVFFVVEGSLDLFEDICAVCFNELHEDLLLELCDNPSLFIVGQLVLSSRLINLRLLNLEIVHEYFKAFFIGLLLTLELPNAVMSNRLHFLLAISADHEKGLAISSPMRFDCFLVVENPLDLCHVIANVRDTAGFSSAIVSYILLSTVMLALSFQLGFSASHKLSFSIVRFFTLPHALFLVIDDASILSFAIGAVGMVGSWLVVFLECATDVFGIVFILLDWALLRHTLRVRAAIMYLSIVFWDSVRVGFIEFPHRHAIAVVSLATFLRTIFALNCLANRCFASVFHERLTFFVVVIALLNHEGCGASFAIALND